MCYSPALHLVPKTSLKQNEIMQFTENNGLMPGPVAISMNTAYFYLVCY